MAAKLTADPDTRIITITEAPVGGFQSLDVQADIYSALKDDWQATPALQALRFPFRTFGDSTEPGKQIGPYVFFNNLAGWRFLPYDVDHELSIVGNLAGESGVQGSLVALFNARPGRTIQIRDKLTNQCYTLETGVSGLTGSESTALIQARDYALEVRKLLRNKKVLDRVTGIETVYDDNGSVLYTRNVYENEAGTAPYDGNKAPHRVERFT